MKSHYPASPNLSLTLGFSPCPNDTFMFDAMVNGKTDTEGLVFNPVVTDVETLNKNALHGAYDISKVSYATLLKITGHYQLLNAGSALGRGVGPLLVSKNPFQVADIRKGNLKIAVPGYNTTANFLYTVFFHESNTRIEMVFSGIEDAILSGEADAGVIIHENRFTYEEKGLKKICDLGELWEQETGQPVPLGGIAVRRNFPDELKQKIDRAVKRSVQFAFANPESGAAYVKQYSQEMDAEVRRKHIETYVNNFSIDLGKNGRDAIAIFFEKAREKGMPSPSADAVFIEPVEIPANE